MVESKQIPKGFKNTDVGIIPKEWDVKNIVANSTMKARIGWQGLTVAEYLDKGDYLLITGTDFDKGKIKWETCHYVQKIRYSQDKNIQIKLEDILITKDGTIGKVAYINKLPLPATLNSGVFVIRPKDNSYLSIYLFYIFNSLYFYNFLNKLVAGSTIIHLYQKDFISFNFPLPPTLSEQKAIATALNDTDELISKLEKLISKKRAIKQGTMQELLKPKKGWEVKKIGELTKVFTKQTGFDYSAYIKPSLVNIKTDETIPFIQNKDFNGKKINFNTDYYIPKTVAFNFPKILLNEKSLLISISGSVGNVGIFESKELAFIGGAVAILKFKRPSLIDWTWIYLKSEIGQEKLFGNTKSSSHVNLILDDIRKIEIEFPKEEEQNRISQILSDIDTEIESLEKKLEKLQYIMQGMMQNLLTGKIRLE